MNKKVTAQSLREMEWETPVTFEGLAAAEIDTGKAMACIYGKRLECRFVCSSDYAGHRLTITKQAL